MREAGVQTASGFGWLFRRALARCHG
ncbi:MAG: PEP-CTERM sorting domain-containing protein [Rhizobiales bacterium]|nr:PEP-CTERM sorting domain-containing protein [Hyphomicrobiales bacterium]